MLKETSVPATLFPVVARDQITELGTEVASQKGREPLAGF